jgi:hypothetical protein
MFADQAAIRDLHKIEDVSTDASISFGRHHVLGIVAQVMAWQRIAKAQAQRCDGQDAHECNRE